MTTRFNTPAVQPGMVVTVDFPGVTGVKRRPAVVVSSGLYHRTRPDVILGLVTSQVPPILAPSDCVLQDWQSAGLRKPSIFRAFLLTKPVTDILIVGQVSTVDWQAIQSCMRNAMAIDAEETAE